MDNLILGMKSFLLGITTIILTAISPTTTAPITSPTPSPTSQVNQSDIVTRSGEYSYSGHTLKYLLNVPKNGGEITGSFSGVCEGPITGRFDGSEGGTIEGGTEVNCHIAIFSYALKANYFGKLYLKAGRAEINWSGKIPYTKESGSFTINFEHVK